MDLRLCVVPVADAAHPQSADLDQPRNVFPQRLFKMSQIQDKPIRRRCANLKLSTRTARRKALTRATSRVNPFRRPFATRRRAADLAPMIRLQYRILDCWMLRYACFRFHAIVTRLSRPSFTQKSLLPHKTSPSGAPPAYGAYLFRPPTGSLIPHFHNRPNRAVQRWGLSPRETATRHRW